MNYNNQQIENKSNNTIMFNVKDSQSCHIGARNYNKSTYPSYYVFLHTWQINNMPFEATGMHPPPTTRQQPL